MVKRRIKHKRWKSRRSLLLQGYKKRRHQTIILKISKDKNKTINRLKQIENLRKKQMGYKELPLNFIKRIIFYIKMIIQKIIYVYNKKIQTNQRRH